MVDMSASLIHHGHVRILKKAKKFGYVIIALTTDKEFIKFKKYKPELNYKSRKEILEAIKYVDEVIPSPWLIDEDFLRKNKIDKLVHGSDNFNKVSKKMLLIFPRTKGISSSIIRRKTLKAISDICLNKF